MPNSPLTLSAGAEKTRGLAERIRAELGVPIVIGGTHASYYPESCLEFSDYVVFGEDDETILDLVDALVRGRDVAEVPGIATGVAIESCAQQPVRGRNGLTPFPTSR